MAPSFTVKVSGFSTAFFPAGQVLAVEERLEAVLRLGFIGGQQSERKQRCKSNVDFLHK